MPKPKRGQFNETQQAEEQPANEQPKNEQPEQPENEQPENEQPEGEESGGREAQTAPGGGGGDGDQTDAGNASPRDQFAATLNQYVEAFGTERGARYLADGKTWSEALEADNAHLREQLEAKDKQIAELNEKLGAVDRGEEEPVEFQDATHDPDAKRAGQYREKLGDGVGAFAASLRLPPAN